RANGCCVLVSSHLLDFVDDLADRVLFLGGGRLIRETKPDGRTTEAVYRQEFMAGVNRESPDPPGTVRRAGPEKRLP
ncbi:MAG: hypothetical protein LBJ02_07060, partial [Bifidobacteriaceae bacterium]|nr:hypothetical protein [Bifidobacteriaceae bacterium]